jgi:anaerobic C4-dicarboxylate transporter
MDASFVTALSGVLVAGILGLTLYLGAPGQQLRPTPLVPRLTSALAIALGSGAIVLLRRVLGPAEAVYATILIVTIVTTVLPFLAAALRKSERSVP